MKRWISLFFLLFFIDRFVKLFFLGIDNVFENERMIFGMVETTGFLIFATLVIVFLLFLAKGSLGLFLIFLGGVCNLVDRFVYDYVVDYIDVFSLPVFNLADLYISLGVILVFLRLFRFGVVERYETKSDL